MSVQSIAGGGKKKSTSRVTALKAATDSALIDNAGSVEDQFTGVYLGADGAISALEPPFNPRSLLKACQQNNTLGVCVDAMEVNIDGTGHEIKPKDGDSIADDAQPDEEYVRAKSFFDEPYPGMSMITLRRLLRRDLEQIGWGFLEVLRTPTDEVTFLNYAEAQLTRLVKLSDEIKRTLKVTRGGAERSIEMMVRPRRFVQKVGTTIRYFKEYGVERDLDKETGRWAPEGQRLPYEKRASELLYFTVNPDYATPYAVPRWIQQLPSVFGSRKAEEMNLGYFDAGGIPPVLFIVSGGTMDDTVRKQLEAVLSGKGGEKNRGAVVEVTSTAGGLNDGTQPPRVGVERFGSERQADSMFETYIGNSEQRVRASFRLPAIFIGRTDSYNFATAYASYVVAEAQVFKPERTEFDEIINATIMREIAPNYKFESVPLTVTDIENLFQGLQTVVTAGAITKGDLVREINKLTGLKLPIPVDADDPVGTSGPQDLTALLSSLSGPTGNGNKPPNGKPAKPGDKPDDAADPTTKPTKKGDSLHPETLLRLANDWADYVYGKALSDDSVRSMTQLVESLNKADRRMFDNYISMRVLNGSANDPDGGIDLCGLAFGMMN